MATAQVYIIERLKKNGKPYAQRWFWRRIDGSLWGFPSREACYRATEDYCHPYRIIKLVEERK